MENKIRGVDSVEKSDIMSCSNENYVTLYEYTKMS
jgi:hypothetical protein